MIKRHRLLHLPRPYRGHCLVAGAFLVLLAGWGAVYSQAAFAPVLLAEARLTPAAVAALFSIAAGVSFLLGPFAGRLSDRLGPRPVTLAGMLIAGAGTALAGMAEGFTGFALSYGMMVGTGVGLSYGPAMAAVACHFQARRGLACGIAAMGIGVGTLLVPMTSRALAMIGDWRLELSCLGIGVLVLGLLGAALLGGRPELRVAGNVGGKACNRAAVADTEAALRRQPGFRRLWLGTTLVSVPAAVPYAQLVPYALDAGLDARDAVALIGLIGLGSILGRLVLGAAADRIGRLPAYLACCLGLSLACLAWALSGAAGLSAFALVFGVLQGGFVALSPAVVVDLCGRSIAATATGLLHSGRGIAVLAGPPAFAAASVWMNSGALPILGCAVLGVAGCAAMPGSLTAAKELATAILRAFPRPNKQNSSFSLASTQPQSVLGA